MVHWKGLSNRLCEGVSSYDPSFDAIVISFRCVSSGSHMFVFSSHTCPAHSETSTAALTTPALDRRSLRWFGISACTATTEDLPPSLAQHGSCRRSSTSSALPFRTHVGARNRVVAGQAACLYSLMRPSQRVVRTSRRNSTEVQGRPGAGQGWVQWRAIRRRCQRSSVSGVTSQPARCDRDRAAATAPSRVRSSSARARRFLGTHKHLPLVYDAVAVVSAVRVRPSTSVKSVGASRFEAPMRILYWLPVVRPLMV